MAFNLTYRAFKGMSEADFKAALERIISEGGGAIEWNVNDGKLQTFDACHRNDVHTLSLEWEMRGEDYLLCCALSELLKCPWIELRIQLESHWDYTLYLSNSMADNFSTLPEFWDQGLEFEAARRGDPHKLASLWSVPVEEIERYYVPWSSERVGDEEFSHRKAYERDANGYGDYLQMLDFMRVLGIGDPRGIDGRPVPDPSPRLAVSGGRILEEASSARGVTVRSGHDLCSCMSESEQKDAKIAKVAGTLRMPLLARERRS